VCIQLGICLKYVGLKNTEVCVWFVIVFLSCDQIGHDENSGLTFEHWVSVSTNYKHLSRIEVPAQTHAKTTVT
jgi:hypothetical protein